MLGRADGLLNAGLITAAPSLRRLAHSRHGLDYEQRHFAMPEQSCLTEYCKRPANKMKL